MRIVLDPRKLTFNDRIDFAEAIGTDVIDVNDALVLVAHNDGQVDDRIHRALLWIFTRHHNKTLTLDQAGGVPTSQIEWAFPEMEPEPEDVPADA